MSALSRPPKIIPIQGKPSGEAPCNDTSDGGFVCRLPTSRVLRTQDEDDDDPRERGAEFTDRQFVRDDTWMTHSPREGAEPRKSQGKRSSEPP